MDLSALAKIAPFMNRPVSALSPSDIQTIASAFRIEIDPSNELHNAAVALLKGENVNVVSDLIQNPQSVKKLLELIQKPVAGPDLGDDLGTFLQCPHCHNFFSLKE